MPRDFNGASLAELEDEARFHQARPGDHLCVPFQCPNCQSQNIRGKSISPGHMDDEALECVLIRGILDAFWSRSSKTVGAHLREAKFMIKYGSMLRFDPLPPLGPWPLYQHLGMAEAVMVLMRSMEKGRGAKSTVQYGTARKSRATLTVLWDASPSSGADITLSTSSAKGRFVATRCPSEGRWYQRFAMGINARMGDVVSQDRAYSIEVLLKLLEMFEEEWQTHGYAISVNSICACMFLLVSCLGGMRGFEVVWTDMAALRYDLGFCEDADDFSAVSWPVVGRFKARDGVLDCYMVPIAGVTKSGIQFFRWTQRFVNRLAMEGIQDGWAFRRRDGRRAKAADYQANIFRKLEVIQSTTDLIDADCKVWEDYGIQRSGRRFFTTRCTNMKVSKHDIELQCRWSTDRANGVRTVQRSMIHNYSEVRNMKESLIRPSKAC
jgi:hypothetical protein